MGGVVERTSKVYSRSLVLVPLLSVVVFDVAAWELRDVSVGGISLSLLPLGAIIVCLVLLIQAYTSSHSTRKTIDLPDHVGFKGNVGDAPALYGMLRQIETRLRRMEGAVLTTSQDVKYTQDFVMALDVSLQERERLARVEARSLAILTTMVGIIGGWLPQILSKLPTVHGL